MLDADRGTLARLPELHRLRTALEAAGLGEFIAAMAARQASEDFAVRAFRYAWLASILDHLELTDLAVGSFTAEAHQTAVREYSDGDRRHIETTSARVRRAYAENAIRARDQFKEQAALVEHQAGLKRRHLPVRDFVRNAADVLLALKPCWAMSPLVVSQLLPPQPYFDVVIFDEASQITPADAVTSILRGRQLVVAGDDKQLPPSAWFVIGQHRRGARARRGSRAGSPAGRNGRIRVDPQRARLGPAGSARCCGTTAAATSGSSRSPTRTSTTGC